MHDQIRILSSILNISPVKDEWIAKPREQRIGRISVNLDAGPPCKLDMTDPRSAVWANLLDLQKRYDKPVYLEIDPETSVITRLLIPQPSKVKEVDESHDSYVYVTLIASQAKHYIRREHPDFQDMLNSLIVALNQDKEVLVTATRHDFEIIDVRSYSKPPGAEIPNPPSPPQPDPPVSPARAQELFNLVNSKSCNPCIANCSSTPHCIPFIHAYDGCYARAHEMCRLMMDESEDPEKVWVFGNLHVDTSNVHECGVNWWYHVAPTLMVTNPNGPTEKYVIDPSLCTGPVTVADWAALQNDPAHTLQYTSWEPFWPNSSTTDSNFTLTNYYLELKCTYLQQDCVDFGPPPYVCPIIKNLHFIVDRNTFSESEIDAMLGLSQPAEIEAAFYVIVDGFAPESLGVNAATLTGIPNVKPTLTTNPNVSEMSISATSLDVEDPSHLKRRQRMTWTYKVSFTGTNGFGFGGDIQTVGLTASMSTVSGTAALYLIKQPNPYEVDGATSWLSTDLRVFQIDQGQSKFNVTMGSNPSAFIIQVISNLNSGNTAGQTFENDISVNQQTSKLELSQSVNGTPVYNFAVAKVRYRSTIAPAADVRVFFRMFPWATTSVAFDETSEYRRHESTGQTIALPGNANGILTSIPCFASPRVDSSSVCVTTQTDQPNVQTIQPNAGGNEVVRYYGCWLDMNQTQPQFPINPSPIDGPWSSGRVSVQDHVRNEHICIVSEIAFNPAPVPSGATPSMSDKLAQRNLAIVESANPGLNASRRIPQTFEIRPSRSKIEHDELMLDWGSIPTGSVATIYFPGFNVSDILSLATEKYRTHSLVRIDEHTIKTDTGGMTYLPIPISDGTFPGMLTVDLPEGVRKGQVFKVTVRQVAEGAKPFVAAIRTREKLEFCRHIVGSFQLTIPVSEKTEMLPAQQRLLSNLRWIERVIPDKDHWFPVFSRYVMQIASRVDALGGDSSRVAPSPAGEWEQARRRCFLLGLLSSLFTGALVIDIGTLSGSLSAIIGVPLAALMLLIYRLWQKLCRPTRCQVLKALLAGTGIGALALAVLTIAGITTPQTVPALAVSAGISVLGIITVIVKGCCWK